MLLEVVSLTVFFLVLEWCGADFLLAGMEVELWKRQHKDVGAEYVKDTYGNRVVRADDQVTRVRAPQVVAAA